MLWCFREAREELLACKAQLAAATARGEAVNAELSAAQSRVEESLRAVRALEGERDGLRSTVRRMEDEGREARREAAAAVVRCEALQRGMEAAEAALRAAEGAAAAEAGRLHQEVAGCMATCQTLTAQVRAWALWSDSPLLTCCLQTAALSLLGGNRYAIPPLACS